MQVVRNLHVWVENLLFEVILESSQAYFGQKSEEHVQTFKNIIWRSRTTVFDKHVLCKKKVLAFSEVIPVFKGPGLAHMGTYGPIWICMGPYGPGPGPWWAGKALERNVFVCKFIFLKIVVLDLHITFFDSLNVFFRFLADIRFRTNMRSPQKGSSRTKTCSFGTSVTLP